VYRRPSAARQKEEHGRDVDLVGVVVQLTGHAPQSAGVIVAFRVSTLRIRTAALGCAATLVMAVAGTVGVLYLLRIPVLEGRVDAPFLRAVLLEAAPPPDLKRWLASTPLDLTPGATTTLSFTHRYIGRYEVHVSVAGLVTQPVDTYDTGLRLRWTCRGQGPELMTREIGGDPLPWWRSFRTPGQSGFIFLVYEVPRDLPRAEHLVCTVTVVTPSQQFLDRYGEATLYVSKMSEE
jgi:hypothetical protein